ncbi:GNAT family N-acetyltransferase [Thermodesulfobacteriota bacterium]
MEKHELDNLKLSEYYPGVIGKITELHAVYYFENWGFDISFETQVAKELSDFITEFRPGRDGFWAALVNSAFAGSIAIDGSLSEKEGARLRWFIVEPGFQGLGIGGALLRHAIQFCRDAGHRNVFLWTFRGLDAARTLYEREGFRLSVEKPVHQWGREIIEEQFTLDLSNQ